MVVSEFALIDWLRGQSCGRAVGQEVGIGDDMAVLGLGQEKVLITTDLLLAGVHFDLRRATLEEVGYKAMACSLSDCAAMASAPWCAVVSVALPAGMGEEEAQRLHAGLMTAAKRYSCPVVGGDTTCWEGELAVNVTMLARAAWVAPVRRSGAEAGDAVLVTGTLGGSLAGRHLAFEPRVNEARRLAGMVRLKAMIDISDGLSQDLEHICRESGVGAVVEAEAVPVSEAARQIEREGGRTALEAALGDGEDYELLFCVSEAEVQKLLTEWPCDEVALTRIGRIVAAAGGGEGARLRLREGGEERPLEVRGWQHGRRKGE